MRAANNLFVGNFRNSIDAVHSWLIIENNTFAAGPDSAIIFENQAQHFSPSRIAGNVFLGSQVAVFTKPGPVMPVVVNNLVAGLDESDATVPTGNGMFEDDAASASVDVANYDAASRTTTLRWAGPPQLAPDLAGRVVNVGERWGVVRSADARTLVVWGDLTAQSGPLRIVPTYRPRKDSAAAGFGAYVPRPQGAKSQR